MKDATRTVLYIEETRGLLQAASCPRSIQSNRATERPADHVTHRSAAWQLVVASLFVAFTMAVSPKMVVR